MAKTPTLELNPTAQAPAQDAPESLAPDIVVDSKGRTLKLTELDVLAESRLIRVVGAEAAMNPAYMRLYVMPAVSVVQIDGEDVPMPMTQREIDAAIGRLGHHGINAVIEHLSAQRKNEEDEKAAVKN
ncbi:hypothetical protein RA280_15390 [Cupriavidus sp. CV2]|uniref:hypothetical protein n=1 Tax=Cupriavidus ulmosensis TaxID=3065913 RepID=UPI00296AD7B7|nr:hypothetical protein [Cupriavidus sp. CV2]MDW3683109.1 hypothetical protein [Cupriavidus sp. CV2]